MQRGGPWVPGQEQVVVFFRKTPLMMKSGRFTRLVMLELGPRAMKTEDGAQDRGPAVKKDLVACEVV